MTDQLLRTESACLQGQLDPTTPTCVAAISQVHRDPITDLITQIDTPKQNLAEENLDVLLFTLNYGWSMGALREHGVRELLHPRAQAQLRELPRGPADRLPDEPLLQHRVPGQGERWH